MDAALVCGDERLLDYLLRVVVEADVIQRDLERLTRGLEE
jgi:hypothetical protein